MSEIPEEVLSEIASALAVDHPDLDNVGDGESILLPYGSSGYGGAITINIKDVAEAAFRGARLSALIEALEHAEAILSCAPEFSTNKFGKGPNTTTRLARDKVREALANYGGEK